LEENASYQTSPCDLTHYTCFYSKIQGVGLVRKKRGKPPNRYKSHPAKPIAVTGQFTTFFSLVRVLPPYIREKNAANRPASANQCNLGCFVKISNSRSSGIIYCGRAAIEF